ncbi:amidohydrolase family protein [Truncatella angustata]|uniref:Amidohydrolase family protein n=1 Tax=Truncatella angustata TaxID=152316 RepID=A0A9P8UES5_9PEZI|nr:amidohydrolase family protein [Truncatella angustata]KAH6648599.1 amidohydrolase family protein [Truncatella angustata]KAH8199480.1 hypothetical protein TruAng_006356 [Truncatella angustata]
MSSLLSRSSSRGPLPVDETSMVLQNGRFFLPQSGRKHEGRFADCIVIDQTAGKILHVGSDGDPTVQAARAAGAKTHDMNGRVVLPGFVDSHMHLLMTGESMSKLDIGSCTNLEEIQSTIRDYARANPNLSRLLCRNWWQSSTNGEALAKELDDLDSRPIYIDANDLHSVWCNTVALEELKVDDLEDPPNGHIHRDENGRPSGLLSESAAVTIVWPFLSKVSTTEQKFAFLDTAFEAYISAGYTGVGEMAMEESLWDLLTLYESQKGPLPLWVTAYWFIIPQESGADTLKQVERAIELYKESNTGGGFDGASKRRVGGIKIICDGVVDACTAALREPYSHDNKNADPMWTVESLTPVLKHADAAGLQCAIHAIGDQAIKVALDSLEQVGNPSGRHRIEHLELCSPEDAKRLGPLGIVASVQPVHSDPAGLTAWPKLIGPVRCKHIFPYASFADFGAVLAISTDSPTAPHDPLANIFVATNRRSARKPDLEDVVTPQFALKLAEAVAAATQGAAYACRADASVGKLEPGLTADLVAVDMEWDHTKLLRAKVAETWSRGQKVFDAAELRCRI